MGKECGVGDDEDENGCSGPVMHCEGRTIDWTDTHRKVRCFVLTAVEICCRTILDQQQGSSSPSYNVGDLPAASMPSRARTIHASNNWLIAAFVLPAFVLIGLSS